MATKSPAEVLTMIHSTRGRPSQQTGLAHGRNPATGQVEYSDEELAWLKAIDRCRRLSGKPSLSVRDAFRIAWSMGYRKVAAPEV